MDDLDEMKDGCTGYVEAWLNGLRDEPEGAFLLQRYGIEEATQEARDADDAIQAAAGLRAWFLDRLTTDPGIPGPFAALAINLLTECLELVDWERIALNLREP